MMTRQALIIGLLAVFLAGCGHDTPTDAIEVESAAKKGGRHAGCTTIQEGTLLGSDGNIIETGFDAWGYNYQAHMFSGGYCDAYRDAAWCQPYKDDRLGMKWNAAWLDNKDCDGDSALDRHAGFDSYLGSGAWLTNHMAGTYEGEDGKSCKWTYFVKIVAAPSGAVKAGSVWLAADGSEVGPAIWGQFAIIQEVSNDACAGQHGKQFGSPVGPGLGKF